MFAKCRVAIVHLTWSEDSWCSCVQAARHAWRHASQISLLTFSEDHKYRSVSLRMRAYKSDSRRDLLSDNATAVHTGIRCGNILVDSKEFREGPGRRWEVGQDGPRKETSFFKARQTPLSLLHHSKSVGTSSPGSCGPTSRLPDTLRRL